MRRPARPGRRAARSLPTRARRPARRSLREQVPPGSAARFVDFVDDLSSYVAAADVVVTRAGYNSIAEILSFGRPSVVIPRVARLGGVDDIKEQAIRAEMLRRRGLACVIDPAELVLA